MKYPILLASLMLFSACGLFKKKQCTSLAFGTENAFMVQANPGASMYMFEVKEGPLAGCQIHLNVQDDGNEKDAFIIKIGDDEGSEMLNKPSWTLQEKIDPEKMTTSLKAEIEVLYKKKEYCIALSYEGTAMKMPEPPAPPAAPED
ncbi:MAG: hypothetical protein LPK45_01120 [Bacteroidota bacterium]|nr:hypothetical protein [Bacteroidota bacterium]MDX5429629.1 hypothetical protein [Bacteroidota bacterium]MDX5468413.1 hypothetical protein [Bacteroidota bacterium]